MLFLVCAGSNDNILSIHSTKEKACEALDMFSEQYNTIEEGASILRKVSDSRYCNGASYCYEIYVREFHSNLDEVRPWRV